MSKTARDQAAGDNAENHQTVATNGNAVAASGKVATGEAASDKRRVIAITKCKLRRKR